MNFSSIIELFGMSVSSDEKGSRSDEEDKYDQGIIGVESGGDVKRCRVDNGSLTKKW